MRVDCGTIEKGFDQWVTGNGSTLKKLKLSRESILYNLSNI